VASDCGTGVLGSYAVALGHFLDFLSGNGSLLVFDVRMKLYEYTNAADDPGFLVDCWQNAEIDGSL